MWRAWNVQKKTQRKAIDTIVVCDTSAVISLSIGEMLANSLNITNMIIPKTVKQKKT